MRLIRRCTHILLGLSLCVAVPVQAQSSAAAPGFTEAEIKAAFLLRLPQFVSWPDQREATHFCVTDSSDVATVIASMIADDPRGRALSELEGAADVAQCDVIFASASSAMGQLAPDSSALRVSDQPGFARSGGMVEMKKRGARMRLVVNLPALESAGLKASSKLLQLSEVLREDAP